MMRLRSGAFVLYESLMANDESYAQELRAALASGIVPPTVRPNPNP